MHNFSTLQKSRLRPRLPSQIASTFLFISPGLSRRQIALCPAVTHNTAHTKKKTSWGSPQGHKVDYFIYENYNMAGTQNICDISVSLRRFDLYIRGY